MVELAEILSKLDQAAKLIDSAVKDISNSDIECKSADILHLAEALAEIFEVNKTIYELSPDLVPDHLKTKIPAPDMNRELGRIIVQNERSLASNKPLLAIARLQQFIDKNPPQLLVNVALGEINKIRTAFNS